MKISVVVKCQVQIHPTPSHYCFSSELRTHYPLKFETENGYKGLTHTNVYEINTKHLARKGIWVPLSQAGPGRPKWQKKILVNLT